MPKITIDGEQHEVEDGQNLLSACLSLGINLPYFCWHPEMGSVGACRQCAVTEYKDSEDQRGKLVMGCMTPVREGGIYSVEAEPAREFRGGIIEDLMTNHPHDCPVCEEGGECHLQDMTEMSGHTYRRFRGLKRTHRNQYLGPLINHEMNRCIACYRCVRFYRDYAGGTDLEALGRNNQVYFGRQQDGVLENGFSGNLVEVCPTGVFTDQTFSNHFVRKWDLQTAPSICEHCAVGCNTAPGAREPGNGEDVILRRVVNLFNREINGYFLCDRGRFGYDYVNSSARIRKVLSAIEGNLIDSTAGSRDKLHVEAPPARALQQFAASISAAVKSQRRLIGIGSPRSSLENNFALRQLVGPEHFYAGLAELDLQLLDLVDRIQRDQRTYNPTTPEIERADAVLILGEDLDNTAPRISLAVRQAARNLQKQQAQDLKIPLWQDASVRQLGGPSIPIIFAGSYPPGNADILTETLLGTPEQVAHFAFLVTELVRGDELDSGSASAEQIALAQRTAHILKSAKRPLIVSGCSSRNIEILKAAGTLAAAIGETSEPCATYLVCPEVNSLGLKQMLPPAPAQGSLEQLLRDTEGQELPLTLIILENDLYLRMVPEQVESLFDRADEVILLDSLFNATARRADLILPAAATAESQGTYVNNNGRAQRFYAVYEGAGFIQESWRWICDAVGMSTRGKPLLSEMAKWQHAAELSAALAAEFEQFAPIAAMAPDEDFRIEGMKIARQSQRYSGRTAIHAKSNVAESPPPTDPDAPMKFSMEGIQNAGRTPLQANIWAPGWNSNQSIHKYQVGVGGPRKGACGATYLKRQARALPEWTWEEPTTNAELQAKRLVPLYKLFGSEELSNRAPAIASLVPRPFALISAAYAEQLGMGPMDRLQLVLDGTAINLDAELANELPKGIVAVPRGMSQLASLTAVLPEYAKIQVLTVAEVAESGDLP